MSHGKFSWVSEGPSPLKETQTVKKNFGGGCSSPGSHPQANMKDFECFKSYPEIEVNGQRWPAVFPAAGPLHDGRRSGADEGLGSRIVVAKSGCWEV